MRTDMKRIDEIGVLSRSLDTMAESLDQALSSLWEANAKLKDEMEQERELEQQRMEFFAAASHELKTPVTILKGQIEGMEQNVGVYKDRDKYLARARRSDGYFAEYGSGNPGDFQNGILRFLIKEKRDGYGRAGEASAGRPERAF